MLLKPACMVFLVGGVCTLVQNTLFMDNLLPILPTSFFNFSMFTATSLEDLHEQEKAARGDWNDTPGFATDAMS